jgi:hypothetical protein
VGTVDGLDPSGFRRKADQISIDLCRWRSLVDGVLESNSVVGVEAFFGGRLWIPSPIELMKRERISDCGRFRWVVFEQGSKLVRIEQYAFWDSGLQAIVIPCSVEVLGQFCLQWCKSLISVTSESKSRLVRIETYAFYGNGLRDIVIPYSVEILGVFCFHRCKSIISVIFERSRD